MGSGSEVSLCIAAYEQLAAEGTRVRVVSMPSWEMFDQQSAEYRESVLPTHVTRRISVEMGSTMGWSRYVGPGGMSIGMKTFGASGPIKGVLQKFGFTPERVVAAAKELLEGAEKGRDVVGH
jgi:transketolase